MDPNGAMCGRVRYLQEYVDQYAAGNKKTAGSAPQASAEDDVATRPPSRLLPP